MLPALALCADLAGTLAVSDRTELRVRAPATAPAPASFDAETEVTARLTLARARYSLALAYVPRLTLWDAESSARTLTLLHGAQARLEWRGRRAVLSLDENASYGSTSFASYSLVPGPEGQPPRVDAIPAPQIIQVASSTTTLASTVTLPRWMLRMSAGYQAGGGANAGARAVLPFQTGPFGEASADYAASRSDHAVVRVSTSETAFSSGPESILVEVDAGYRRLWSRLVETRLLVGAAEARARTSATAADTFATYPVIEGIVERKRGARGAFDVSFDARLGPTVNRLLGVVDQRVGATIMASHTHRRLDTRLLASASQSIPVRSSVASTLLAGEIGAAYRATSVVALDAGLRGFWQRYSETGVPFLQGTMFVGVSLRAPKVKF